MAGLVTGAPIVKLYHEKSMILPDVSRVLACLHEKNINFEIETASYKSLLRLQASSHAPVPFYDGPTFLEESREICRYVAETYEHHEYPFLLGKDALERASIEQWLHHEEHTFNPPSRALFCHLAFPMDDEDDNIEMQKAKLEEVLEVYEQRLSDSEFLAGNKFTLADLVHLPNSHYITSSSKFVKLYDSRKNVQRWWNSISARKSWKEVLTYMTKVEQLHKLEELEKQKQQDWQREHRTATRRRIRLDSRKHTGTRPQTVLVPPPPGTFSASTMAPQAEQPPPADYLSEKAPVSSSQSTNKSLASPSKQTTLYITHQEIPPDLAQSTQRTSTSSTPSLGTFPTTSDKPPIIHADQSSIRDVSVPSDTTKTDLPTRPMLSSSKEVGTYIEPTPQKTPALLDNFSESDVPSSGVSHSQAGPGAAKEDTDRLNASDLYRNDRKSTGVYSEEKESISYTDNSSNKLRSTEAHQMLQAKQWHAATAGLRNLQGDIDNSMPSRQVKPSKDVQQYPPQDSEQASINPVAQEPKSMNDQPVRGPEIIAQTPYTDQTRDVSSRHWRHAAAARRISEDEESSDRRRNDAHLAEHSTEEDAQATPFQTAHDDSEDATPRAREASSAPRGTTDHDAHDTSQGIRTYDSAPSRLQPMDASHDAPLASKKATYESSHTTTPIPTGYQGAQEFIQQVRERPKPKPIVPDDAQGSTEEAKMAESPPSKTQILGSHGPNFSPPKEVLNENGYDVIAPLQSRYTDDQDNWKQARDTTTSRPEDTVEETKMADSESFKAQTLYSQQTIPRKQPPAEDPYFAASTFKKRYFDDQDGTKESKHTASRPRVEAQDSLEETKAGESALPREQSSDILRAATPPLRQPEGKDASIPTPPFQEGYAGSQAVSKQRRDPDSISRRKTAQDARVTFVESKPADSTSTRHQSSDDWQDEGSLPVHKAYDARGSTLPFQDTTMKSEDTTTQQMRGQGTKETKLSDSASPQIQPLDYQRSDSHLHKHEEIEDPRDTISSLKKSYTDVEDITKHPGDKMLGEGAQDGSEETKALDSVIFRARAQPQDTHQAAITPLKQATAKDSLGVTPLSPTRYPTSEDTSRQPRRTASSPTEKAVQDGRDAFRESRSVDSTSSREQLSDVPRSAASLPKQQAADSRSTTMPFQRRYPDIQDTTKEPRDKPREMVGQGAEDTSEGTFEETKAVDSKLLREQSSDTWQGTTTPVEQAVTRDGLNVSPSKKKSISDEDSSKKPRGTVSIPQRRAAQDDNGTLEESKPDNSVSSRLQPLNAWQLSVPPPRQEIKDFPSTAAPFQKRYPEDNSKKAGYSASAPTHIADKGAKHDFEDTMFDESASSNKKTSDTQQAAFPLSNQAEAQDTWDGGRQSRDTWDKGRESRETISAPKEMVGRDTLDMSGEIRTDDFTSRGQSPEGLQASSQSRQAVPENAHGATKGAKVSFPDEAIQSPDVKDTTRKSRASSEETRGPVSTLDRVQPFGLHDTQHAKEESRRPAADQRDDVSIQIQSDAQDISKEIKLSFTDERGMGSSHSQAEPGRDSQATIREKSFSTERLRDMLKESEGSARAGQSIDSGDPAVVENTPSANQDSVAVQDRHGQAQILPAGWKADDSTPKHQLAPGSPSASQEKQTASVPPREKFRDDYGTEYPMKRDIVDDQKEVPPLSSQGPTSQVHHASETSQEAAPDENVSTKSTIDQWWRTSKPLQGVTPISGDDVTGLSTDDQMATLMGQEVIPSAQVANGITKRSVKKTEEPPAPVVPQTIFRQQTRPSAPITREVPTSDNEGAISKIQEVSPDSHPTDYPAVPPVPTQGQVPHAQQTSPGREGITPAQGEIDSSLSDAQSSSEKFQQPAPDESTKPFISSEKHGSHVGPTFEHKIAPSETIPSVGSRKEEATVDEAEQIRPPQKSIGPPDIQNALGISGLTPDDNLSEKSVSNQEKVYNAQYDSQLRDGSPPNVHGASVEENAAVPPRQAHRSDERRDSTPTHPDVKAASADHSTTKSITDQGAQQQQLPAKIEPPPPPPFETVHYSDETLDKSKPLEPPSVDKEIMPPPGQPSLAAEPTKEETVVDASDQTKPSQTMIGQRDISPAVSKEKHPSLDVQNDHLKVDQRTNGSIPSQDQVPNVEPTTDTRDGAFSDSYGATVEEPIAHITGLTAAPDIQHDQDSDRFSEQPSSAKSREEQRDVAAADEAKAKEMTFDHQRTQPVPVPSEASKEAQEGGEDTIQHEQEKQPPPANQSSLPPEKLLSSVPANKSSTDASGKVDPLKQDSEVAPAEHKIAPSEAIPSVGSRKEEATVDEAEQITPAQTSMGPPDTRDAPGFSRLTPDDNLSEKSVSNQEQVYNAHYDSQPRDGSPPNVHGASVEENASVPPSQAQRSDERRDSTPTRLDAKAASADQSTTKSVTDQGAQQQQRPAKTEPPAPPFENYSDETLDKSKPSEPPSADKEVMPPKVVPASARDPQHEHKNAMADLTPRQPSLAAEPTKEETVVDASDQTKPSQTMIGQRDISPAVSKEKHPSLDVQNDHLKVDQRTNGSIPSQDQVPNVEPTTDTRDGAFSDSYGATVEEPIAHITGLTAAPDIQHGMTSDQDSDRFSEQPSSAKSREEQRDVAAADEAKAKEMTFDHQRTQPVPVPSEASKEAQEGGEDTIQHEQEKQPPPANQSSLPPEKLLSSVPANKSSTDASGKVDPLKQDSEVAPAEHKIAPSEAIPSVGSRKEEATVDEAEQITPAQTSMGPPDTRDAPGFSRLTPDDNLSEKSVSNQEQVYNAHYDSQPRDGSPPNVHGASVEENASVPPSQAQRSDERRDSTPTRLDAKAASADQSTTKSVTDQGAQQQQRPAKTEPPAPPFENYSDETLDKSKPSEPPSADKEVMPPKVVPASARDPQHEHKNAMADLTPRQPSLAAEPTKEETVVDASDQTKPSQTMIGQRDISPAVSKEKHPSLDVQNDHLKVDQRTNGSIPSQDQVPNVEPTTDTRDGAFSDSYGATVEEPIAHITGLTAAPDIQHDQDSDRFSEQPSSAKSREEQRDVAAADEAKAKEMTFDHQRTQPVPVPSEASKEAQEGGEDTIQHEQEKQPPPANQSSLPPEKLLSSVPANKSSTDASGKVDPLKQDSEVAPAEHKIAPSEAIPSVGSRKEEATVDEAEQITPAQTSMGPPDTRDAPGFSRLTPDDNLSEKSVSNQEQVYNAHYDSQPRDGSPPNVHGASVEENASVPPSQAQRSDERRDSTPTRLDAKAASADQSTTKSVTDQGAQQQQRPAKTEPPAPPFENYSDETLDKSKPSEPPSADKEVMPPKVVPASARDPQHEHKNAMADLTPRQPSLAAEPTKEETVVDASDQTKPSQTMIGQRDISPAVSKEKHPSLDVQNDHLKVDQRTNGSIPSQDQVPNVEPTTDTRDGAFSDSYGATVEEPIAHITGLTAAPDIQHGMTSDQDSDRFSEQPSSAKSREEQRDVAAADEAKAKEMTFDHQRTQPVPVPSEASKEAQEGGEDTIQHEQEKQPPPANQSSLPPEKLLSSVPANKSSTDASGKVDPLKQDSEVAPAEHKIAPSEAIPSVGSRKEEATVDEAEQITPAQTSMGPPDTRDAPGFSRLTPDDNLSEKSVSNQEQVYNAHYDSQPRDGSPPNVHGASVEENASVPPSQAQRSDERRDSTPTRLDAKAASADQSTTKSVTDQGAQQQQRPAKTEPPAPPFENYSDETLDKSKPSEPPSADKEVMPPKVVPASARDPQHEHKNAMADLTPRQPSLAAEPTKEETVVDASDQTKTSLNQVKGLGSFSEGSTTDETVKAPMMSSPPAPNAPQDMDPVRPSGEAFDFLSDEKTTVSQDGQPNNLPNVSPSVSASQVVGRSENGAGTEAPSEEMAPSNSQENNKWTSIDKISKQQQQTDLSRTKSFRDDIKEANGVGANISATPGYIQPSPSKESVEVTEQSRNQQNTSQAIVQSSQDSKEQVEETKEQNTGTGDPDKVNLQKNMNQMNNGTSQEEALDQSGKQASGLQPIGSDKNNVSESTKDTSSGIQTYNKPEKSSVTSEEYTRQLQAKDNSQGEETETPASETEQPKERDPQANSNRNISSQSQAQASDISEGQTSSTEDMNGNSRKTDGSTNDTTPGDTEDNPSR